VLRDPGAARLREAAVTMAATLLSFGSVLWLKHAVGLTSGSVLLAVVLAISVGRQQNGRDARHRQSVVLAPLLLPPLAVVAGEVSKRMYTHPNIGDALFVVGMSGAIWLRRFGGIGRRTGTLLTTTLTATLISPGPVVPLGAHAPTRWWGAVVAMIALASVRVTRAVADAAGVLRTEPAEAEAPTRKSTSGRLSASTKLALQMAVALAGAFAAGRAMFGVHWTWTVLTAFIVGSGNRGRGDVTQKAILRLTGAAGGTLIATALANAFPAGDDWSVVTIFVVLAIALWLRPLSYSYWAAGMTAALALLYGFYGEQGNHLLVDRMAGILTGAAIGVAAAWLVLPIRNVDAIRKQLSVALGELAARLADDASFPPETVALIRDSTRAAELAAGSVRWQRVLPARMRTGLPYAEASGELARGAADVAALPERRLALSVEARMSLAADVTAARRALARDAAKKDVADLPVIAKRIAAAFSR
jgi:hypothetical protein